MRYYCPRCGEVRCGVPRHDEIVVTPHYRQTSERFSLAEPCLGGPVKKGDRAP